MKRDKDTSTKDPAERTQDRESESVSGEVSQSEEGNAGTERADEHPDEAEAPPALSPEEIRALQEKAAERDAFREELMRARADLENLQKRTRKERPLLEAKGAQQVLTDLLGVVDNFERALNSLNVTPAPEASSSEAPAPDGRSPEEDNSALALLNGVRMIHQLLLAVLANHGVQEIAALGEKFDPSRHEAVAQVDVDDRPTGEVVNVLQKGYRHRDTVLRPSSVAVARNVGRVERAEVNEEGGTGAEGEAGAAGEHGE